MVANDYFTKQETNRSSTETIKPMKSPIKSLALIGVAAMFLIIAPALPVTSGDNTKRSAILQR